jgi:SAM-dependent methyltransferase
LLASLLDGQTAASEYSESNLIAGRRVLHFAPERQLRDRIKASSSLYVTADYERGDCDLQLNMSAMPSVSDASFDILIACDVLEHVPDDRQAIHEIRRILKPGGTAILTVPQADPPAATDEDPSVTDPAERESRFGQKDHLRIYGEDFAGRLQREHFLVKVITADSFPMETIRKHVLFPPALSPHRLATNHRRIYLASPNES